MLRSTLKIFFLLASFSFLAACGGGDDGPDCTDTAQQMRGSMVIAMTCTNCHSASLTGTARNGAPPAVNFDNAADIDMHEAKIRTRAIDVPSMPPAANGGPIAANQIADLEAFLDCR
jgi:uncharacterized membrane protein